MDNDSLDALLLRHYGDAAPTPPMLEHRLIASVRQEKKQQVAHHIYDYRLSRRRAVKLVAVGSAGLGILGAGLGLIDASLFGQKDAQHVLY